LIHEALRSEDRDEIAEAQEYLETAHILYEERFGTDDYSFLFYVKKFQIEAKKMGPEAMMGHFYEQKNLLDFLYSKKFLPSIINSYETNEKSKKGINLSFKVLPKQIDMKSPISSEEFLKYLKNPKEEVEGILKVLCLQNLFYENPNIFDFLNCPTPINTLFDIMMIMDYQKGMFFYKQKNYFRAIQCFQSFLNGQHNLSDSTSLVNFVSGKVYLYCAFSFLVIKNEKYAKYFFTKGYNLIVHTLINITYAQILNFGLQSRQLIDFILYYDNKIKKMIGNSMPMNMLKMYLGKMREILIQYENNIEAMTYFTVLNFKGILPCSFSFKKMAYHYLQSNPKKSMNLVQHEIRLKKKIYGERNFARIYPSLERFEEILLNNFKMINKKIL